ncbi:MAG: tRNA 2-thiouridine(34) synthase MnmA [Endomicrobiia bacterium]
MRKQIVVLMSGGVDSSVAAYLLSQRYDIIGLTLKLWNCDDLTETQRQLCCSPKDIYDAKNVCFQLGIPHYVLDLSKEFENYIVKNFCEGYLLGKTPNPCIVCNAKIKFYSVLKKVNDIFNIKYIATGHYARIVKEDNKFFIAKAKDELKDQSYFLSQISKEFLPYIIFPLGELLKDEVRNIAEKVSLKVARKKESFDLCFVPDRDYRKFLLSKGYKVNNKGKIVDIKTKRFLGYHKGYINYTIGQRSGLGLKNFSKRKYVVEIDPQENIVYVGDESFLYSDKLIAKNCVFYEEKEKIYKNRLFAKIRYKSDYVECRLEIFDDYMRVEFLSPQKAITKGQYVVIYDINGKILCSGEIS